MQIHRRDIASLDLVAFQGGRICNSSRPLPSLGDSDARVAVLSTDSFLSTNCMLSTLIVICVSATRRNFHESPIQYSTRLSFTLSLTQGNVSSRIGCAL
ncbi:hypothetical protein BJV77DRAFT_740975 [Russula vinacea]|nr:hypothetical protein BJV77DRAFT_740975 [Russula vinacea]